MTGPHPAVAAARAAVRSALADLPRGSLVLVACSGGPDSLALAAATAFCAPRLELHAGAVCVDHGLQPGSGPVAAQAVTTCRHLGLEPAWAERVVVSGPGGLEAAARRARYAALDAAAERTHAACVLLGHTLDDQAETVLLGLARGAGARSLAGMPAVRDRYRRPFLGLRRAETLAACAALGLAPWLDPMNAAPDPSTRPHPSTGPYLNGQPDLNGPPDPGSAVGAAGGKPALARAGGQRRRVAVRHQVLPALERALGPGAVPALARTAALLRDDADLLERLAAELLAACVLDRAPGRLDLDVEALRHAAPALRGRALRSAALEVGSPAGAIGAAHIEEVARLVTHWHGQGPLDLPGRVEATRRCGRLSLRMVATGGRAGDSGEGPARPGTRGDTAR